VFVEKEKIFHQQSVLEKVKGWTTNFVIVSLKIDSSSKTWLENLWLLSKNIPLETKRSNERKPESERTKTRVSLRLSWLGMGLHRRTFSIEVRKLTFFDRRSIIIWSHSTSSDNSRPCSTVWRRKSVFDQSLRISERENKEKTRKKGEKKETREGATAMDARVSI
jgi:hypothetical protein